MGWWILLVPQLSLPRSYWYQSSLLQPFFKTLWVGVNTRSPIAKEPQTLPASYWSSNAKCKCWDYRQPYVLPPPQVNAEMGPHLYAMPVVATRIQSPPLMRLWAQLTCTLYLKSCKMVVAKVTSPWFEANRDRQIMPQTNITQLISLSSLLVGA